MYLKNHVWHASLMVILQSCSYSLAVENTDFVLKVAAKSGTTTQKAIDTLAAAGPYICVAVQACVIAQEIKSHIFPNEEEKARAYAISEKFALLTAENEFEKCLVKNRNTPERARSGLPASCEEIAHLPIMLGGKRKVDNMATIYNKYRE